MRESPRTWYDCFHHYMVSQNFVKSEYDEKDPVYIILYGDDSVLCSSNLNKLQQLKENLNKKIEMKDRERLWKI